MNLEDNMPSEVSHYKKTTVGRKGGGKKRRGEERRGEARGGEGRGPCSQEFQGLV